jgi:hypothetical protein
MFALISTARVLHIRKGNSESCWVKSGERLTRKSREKEVRKKKTKIVEELGTKAI